MPGLPLHEDYTESNIHTPYRKEFADAAEREAYTVTAADIAAGKRKQFFQIDDYTVWNPIATGAGADKWAQVGVEGAASTLIAGTDTGAADAYVVTFTPTVLALEVGLGYRFKAVNANTGASTINPDGLGAKAIKKQAGGVTTALEANDIRADQWVELVWDGTNMQMTSQLGNAGSGSSGGAANMLTVQSFS